MSDEGYLDDPITSHDQLVERIKWDEEAVRRLAKAPVDEKLERIERIESSSEVAYAQHKEFVELLKEFCNDSDVVAFLNKAGSWRAKVEDTSSVELLTIPEALAYVTWRIRINQNFTGYLQGWVDALENDREKNRIDQTASRPDWEVVKALAENDGNVSATARELVIDRRTMQKRIKAIAKRYDVSSDFVKGTNVKP